MFKDFIHNLKKVLKYSFGVLDDGYIEDSLNDLALDLEEHLSNFYELRFVLLKKGSEEMKTKVFFKTEGEAEEIARLTDSRVAMVLIPSPPSV